MSIQRVLATTFTFSHQQVPHVPFSMYFHEVDDASRTPQWGYWSYEKDRIFLPPVDVHGLRIRSEYVVQPFAYPCGTRLTIPQPSMDSGLCTS